ncbi:hypothetical protein ACVDFE_00060 [Lentzea chajnantorensis]
MSILGTADPVSDPATLEVDGILWRPSTDAQDMVGVDYKTQHAYQATVNDLVHVLSSRTMYGAETRLEWWCGARHLDFAVHLGPHRTALDAARYVASILAKQPDFFLSEDGVLVLENGVFVVPDADDEYA